MNQAFKDSVSEQDNVKVVQKLWATINERDIESALEMTDPDVEWRPHAAGWTPHTSAQLLAFFREFQGERQFLEATLYSSRAHENMVLASGSFRLRGRDRLSEFQIHWVYEFVDGRLVRATSYGTRKEALEAMGLPATG